MTRPALAVDHPPIELARIAFTQLTGETVDRIAPLSGGWGHLSWLVRTASGRYLIKTGVRRPHQADLFRQVAAQQLAAAGDVTTPLVVAVGDGNGPLQRPCYVQTWIEGTDGATALARMHTDQATRFGHGLGETLAALHRIKGPRFAEDCAGTVTYPTWKAACTTRLQRLITATEQAQALPAAVLYPVADRLTALINDLDTAITPRLTHRDVYLPNTVMPAHLPHQGAPGAVALLDWEAAAFYDPVWDFVKLGMWVFDRHPQLRAPFHQGYTACSALPDGHDERLTVYQGIEYLAAFPYFGAAWPDSTMLDGFRGLLAGWMDRHGLAGALP
ncbi:phosphotransferase family protein [Actinomadura sp. 3N407]|uniref:phosphotransferase family protein n=1 Tax=Actinomadura sp. 3N407 TaxID=3457423 RepID=UPI003FCD4E24